MTYQQNVIYTIIADNGEISSPKISPKKLNELQKTVVQLCEENAPADNRNRIHAWVPYGEELSGFLVRGAVERGGFDTLRKALSGALVARNATKLSLRVERLRDGSHLYLVHSEGEQVFNLQTGRNG